MSKVQVDSEKAKRILVEELGYTPHKADIFLERFPLINDELVGIVETWLECREIQDVTIEGLSLTELMKIQRCHFLIAIGYLNHLLDEDLSAQEKQEYLEMLRTPPIVW